MSYNRNGTNAVSKVLNSIKNQRYSANHSRFLSWEDCHRAFLNEYKKGFTKNDVEFLALHLVGYLASWGMYRGSSPLLKEYNYLVHKDLIEILFQEKFLPLFGVDETNFDKNFSLIQEAYLEIEEFYKNLSNPNVVFNPSQTLVTKIMLGVYGCIPAFDRFVNDGMKKEKIGKSGAKKIAELNAWLNNNPNFVSDIKSYRKQNFPDYYTYMKLVDMYFWELGI